MSNAGKKVTVSYKGRLDDGTVFDSTADHGEPLEFTCMVGQMIEGFDEAVNTMQIGEVRTVRIPAEEAYGEYDPSKIETMSIDTIPNGDKLPVGKTIMVNSFSGPMPIKVVSIEDGIVTLDTNHPLAGQALTFEIELLAVELREECKNAAPAGMPQSTYQDKE